MSKCECRGVGMGWNLPVERKINIWVFLKTYVRLFSEKMGIIMDILVKIGLFGQNWTFWSKLDFLLKNGHFGKKWTYKANIWSFCSKLDIWITIRHFCQNKIFGQKWTFFKMGVGGRG